jgi:hypothetical protein
MAGSPRGERGLLVTLGRVIYILKLLAQDVANVEEINKTQNKYLIAEQVVHDATGNSSLIRGDNNLIN